MARDKISTLTIRGFQSIRHLEEFTLGDLNVLIGANGAGKSNFINYFRFLSELAEKRLQLWVQKRGGADRLLTFGLKETRQLFSSLRFGRMGMNLPLSQLMMVDLSLPAKNFYFITAMVDLESFRSLAIPGSTT